MIKKLRKKFIIINMFFVATILIIVLGVLFSSSYRHYKNSILFFMKTDLSHAMEGRKDSFTVLSRNDIKKDDRTLWGQIGAFIRPASNGNSPAEGRGPASFYPSIIIKTDSTGTILNTEEHELSVNDDVAAVLVNTVFDDNPGIFSGSLASSDIAPGSDSAARIRDGSSEENNEYSDSSPSLPVSGYISSYGLHYLAKTDSDNNCYIIFADNSFEATALRNLAITCLAIFFVASLLFFLLSFFISKWALTPAEKAWNQQNQFIADASHELKTPITVMLANLNILNQHKNDTISSQHKWVDNTLDEAERMKTLVEDLLFLARSDSGIPSEVTSGIIDLSDCLTDRILGFESIAFEKKVSITYHVNSGLVIKGNEGQLKQLFTILLDNACKYAGSNGSVNIEAVRQDNNVLVMVQNTGDPILPEEIPHIFERFYCVDKSRVRFEGGYGLGLSIAANIVKLHKGKISCTSNSENGTRFTVIFPLYQK